MSSSSYQGAILAAGHGSRMGPFGELFPKPVVPICNKPLVAYQLEHMRSLGIEDVLIVIGHLGERIQEVLGDGSDFGVKLQYVEQEERLGLAHAVGQLERHIDRPFMLMLGDIFFEVSDLGDMTRAFEKHQAGAVIAAKEETDPDAVRRNFSVVLDEGGAVRRVIEKPRHVPNLLKGCGLYLFDLTIFDAIRRTPRTALRDEYELTDSIQILIDLEQPVRAASVVEWDMNVTFIADLVHCCMHQLRKQGKPSCVGENCSLHEGVELVDSVVGDRVTISQPIRLERCVVLSDTTLNHGGHYREMVFVRDAQLGAGDEA
jgi:glucose-1-phosphate thymidylyltransferase